MAGLVTTKPPKGLANPVASINKQEDATTKTTTVPKNRLSRVKVKHAELIQLTSQLSVMLDSGVVLSDALTAISEGQSAKQQKSSHLPAIISEVSASVKGGDSLSQSMAAYPKVFDSMFISMIKTSEASGKMPEMFRILTDYLSFEYETKKQIKGALIYPMIMAIVAVTAVTIMMVFVLPRFIKIYSARDVNLPGLTQFMVDISNMLRDPKSQTMLLTGGIFLAVVYYYWSATQGGRKVIDYIKLHIPVLRTMFIDSVVTRSMRLMATMVGTGVSLLEAIKVIKGSVDNYYFKSLWDGTDKRIRDGYQLSESIMLSPNSELFDPSILQMLKAGEKSGKLSDVTDKISLFYEKKLKSSIKAVTSLIEPLMIVVLGSIIGVIVIALLMPVFKISSVVAH